MGSSSHPSIAPSPHSGWQLGFYWQKSVCRIYVWSLGYFQPAAYNNHKAVSILCVQCWVCNVHCSPQQPSVQISLHGSILSTVSVTMERYVSVVHPHHSLAKKRATSCWLQPFLNPVSGKILSLKPWLKFLCNGQCSENNHFKSDTNYTASKSNLVYVSFRI